MKKHWMQIAQIIVAGGLALGAGACGGTPDGTESEVVGEAAEAFALPSLNGPFNGECVSTAAIAKVTLANGSTVMRGTCTETCKRSAKSLGAWSLHIYRTAPTSDSVVGQKLGTGKSLTFSMDMPYSPGTYYTACDMMFDEGKGPQYVQPFTETTAQF